MAEKDLKALFLHQLKDTYFAENDRGNLGRGGEYRPGPLGWPRMPSILPRPKHPVVQGRPSGGPQHRVPHHQCARFFGLGFRWSCWLLPFRGDARVRLRAALLLPCFPVSPRR
jgi:hypothetical protein